MNETGGGKAAKRRQQVLDAALGVFARDGYNAAAVEDIARSSETSKGGVYFHFPSKQALFGALMDEAGGLLLSRVERAMLAEPDLLAKGDAALRTVLATFAGKRALARLLLVEALGAGSPFTDGLTNIHDRFTGLIARYLDDAIAAGVLPAQDTELAAVAWFGAVNQVVTRWVLTGEPEQLEDAYPTLRELLLYGVAGAKRMEHHE